MKSQKMHAKSCKLNKFALELELLMICCLNDLLNLILGYKYQIKTTYHG